MKALILSDIHGSADAVRKALAYFNPLHCDKIFLLGDTLYHGPRNPLPKGHGPMGVVEALRPYAEKIVAARGNCDADVDLMMLDFVKIEDEYAVVEDAAPLRRTIRLFLSHGHIFMPECFPMNALEQLEPSASNDNACTTSADTAKVSGTRPIDAYLYGHTHIFDLKKNFKGVQMFNPGSTSLPKGGNPATFGLYESFDKADAEGNIAKFSVIQLDSGAEISSVFLKQ